MFRNRMAHVLAGDYTPLSAVDFVRTSAWCSTRRATKFPAAREPAHQMGASSAGFAKEDDSAVIRFPRHRLPAPENDVPPAASPTTYRRDRPRQQPGPRRHARGADDRRRRAGGGRRRCRLVARNSRTAPPADAVARSSRPLAEGERRDQIYFKVCSTFDSTPRGLSARCSGADGAAGRSVHDRDAGLSDNGRTVFKGHLFVGDVLLSGGMRGIRDAIDANLVRVQVAQLAETAAACRRGASAWSTIGRPVPRRRRFASASGH
jgi:hypothetical protein